MRSAIGILITLTLTTGAIGLTAQSPGASVRKTTIQSAADYQMVMKELNAIVAADFKVPPPDPLPLEYDGPDPLEGPQRLWVLLRDVQAYWEGRNVSDAAGFAKAATASIEDVALSLIGGDRNAIEAARKNLVSHCQRCHAAYREQLPGGTFRMK